MTETRQVPKKITTLQEAQDPIFRAGEEEVESVNSPESYTDSQVGVQPSRMKHQKMKGS